MAARIFQIISGILVAFWLILIGLAQVNCSIFPSFGRQCSHGEGDIWLLPFMYSPIGGIALLVWVAITLVRWCTSPSREMPNTVSASAPVAPIAVSAPVVADTSASRQETSLHPMQVAIAGGTITLVVLVWSIALMSNVISPASFFLYICFFLVPWFLPTFLAYVPLAACILGLRAKQYVVAGWALLAVFIPFGFYANALNTGLTAKANERSAIAAIPKAAFPKQVGGIVIEGAQTNCARRIILSSGHNIQAVLTHGQNELLRGDDRKSPYLRFTQEMANSPVDQGQAINVTPKDYLLIHFPDRSQFLGDRVVGDVASPAVEIYSVDSGGRSLVAVTYAADERLPAFPPVLTIWGWYTGENSVTSEMECKSVTQFLKRELLDKMSALGESRRFWHVGSMSG